MSFVPQQGSPDKMPSALRRIAFWISMIGLAVVLWVLSPRAKHPNGPNWLIVFGAVVAVLVGWTILYLVWKRLSRHPQRGVTTPNGPIG